MTSKYRRAIGLALAAVLGAASSGCAGEPVVSPPRSALFGIGWHDPSYLPRRYRNHCRFDVTHGRYYCSHRCGLDYEFYYCAPASFGCCHIDHGYCGFDGLLRCRP